MDMRNLNESERALIIDALIEKAQTWDAEARKAHMRGIREGYTDDVLDRVTYLAQQADKCRKAAKKVTGVGYYVKA